MTGLINIREICKMTIAIEFLPFLRGEEKWFVSEILGSKESDLYFSPWKFCGHYLVAIDDQSAWSIYKILAG
jgi:hypothetical protein